MNPERAHRLIENAVQVFHLDLQGLKVLTEAATGQYIYGPLIAAAAGADMVFALTRDSRYGSAADIQCETMALAECWGLADRIAVLISRNDRRISEADIVTNVGFVRPLDVAFLSLLSPTAVVPLMWESWEFRPEDLDLPECRRLGIPVLGTNERLPELQMFRYVGHLAVKLLFELEIEVFRSRVAVFGGGAFGESIEESLRQAGTETLWIKPELHVPNGPAPDWRRLVVGCDAIVVAEHHYRGLLIGPGGLFEADDLASLNPGMVLAHIAGGVNAKSLERARIPYLPNHIASAGYMSLTPAYLGPRPLIDLHSAGLKVGEAMARARKRGLHGTDAEHEALKVTALAQSLP